MLTAQVVETVADLIKSLRARLLSAAIAAVFSIATPLVDGHQAPAIAQTNVAVTAELRLALDAFGRWIPHQHWGEVWIPARRAADWRPYRTGRWVYTDEWGWYWIAAAEEADWGWATYHYGRWAFDRQLGWVWIPGDEWAPAWVIWRHGGGYAGWAPLPPDDMVDAYWDDPQVWMFVQLRNLIAPLITRVLLPPAQRTIYIRETVVVNRTVNLRDRGQRIAVNPGIAASVVTAATKGSLRTFDIRPRVLPQTIGVRGAVPVRAEDIRRSRDATPSTGASTRIRETVVERGTAKIAPAQPVQPPQPLEKGAPGRLGDAPPRAAREAAPPSPAARPEPARPAPSDPAARPEPSRPVPAAPPAARPAPPPAAAPSAPAARPEPSRPTPAAPPAARPAPPPAASPSAPAARPEPSRPEPAAPPAARPAPPPAAAPSAPAARPEPSRPTPAARPEPSRPTPAAPPAARPEPSRPAPQAPTARPEPARPAPQAPAARPQPSRQPTEEKPR
jgi:hypothetical protein